MSRKKIIVLGFDGATFDLIDRFVKEGSLPNFRRILEEGYRNILKSTIPAATIPAWPSFYTGKNPAKFGIFDFFTDNNGDKRIVTRDDVKSNAIWDILGCNNLFSIVVNVPCTYPPKEIKGVLASGMLTRVNSNYVFPQQYQKIFDEVVNGYRVNTDTSLLKDLKDISNTTVLDDVKDVTKKQISVFRHLLNNEDWDFAILMLRGTDIVQHHLWNNKNAIKEIYRLADELIGNILTDYNECLKFIMSDHGFTEEDKLFHINKWLLDEGYLQIKKVMNISDGNIIRRSNINGSNEKNKNFTDIAFTKLGNLGINKSRLRRIIPGKLYFLMKKWFPGFGKQLKDFNYVIAWEFTKAHAQYLWTTELKAVYINLAGRDGNGIVAKSDYEKLRNEIIGKMQRLQCPITGKKIIREVYEREDIYKGKYLEKSPDILYLLNDGYNITNAFNTTDFVTIRTKCRGCHNEKGIFIAHGKDVRNYDNTKSNFHIYDLAPTILHCLGMSVDEDMDGRVLKEIFKETSCLYHREITYAIYPYLDTQEDINDEDEHDVKVRLKALGYLG